MGLVAFMVFAALVLDLGREILAVQKCQDVADMAALSGATGLRVYPPGIPDYTTSGSLATDIIVSNNAQAGPMNQVVVNPPSDITYYGPNSTYTGILNTGIGKSFQTLGPRAYIIKVTGHLWVPF